MIQIKKELQTLRKGLVIINDYMLRIKLLVYEHERGEYSLFEEEKLMYILSDHNESYDYVFWILTKWMLNEIVTIDDARALLLSHECRLERRRNSTYFTITIS